MSLSINARSNDVVEPMIKLQWFLNCKTMANLGLAAIRSKKLPQLCEQDLQRWSENAHDCCVSKKYGPGYPIPAWQADMDSTVVESGPGILFHWLRRIMMMGKQLGDHAPFQKVHLAVNENDQQKVEEPNSAIDPIEVVIDALAGAVDLSKLNIEMGDLDKYPNGISQCGTDALRFVLFSSSDKHLPQTGDSYCREGSIMISGYPSVVKEWIDDELESEIAAVLEAILEENDPVPRYPYATTVVRDDLVVGLQDLWYVKMRKKLAEYFK
ncbi:hypothetical protein HU200_050932 [Digitaria exilis]|uniref:valine--tRNA ligase n=1 Tax=Digitaria exilis TaxID=1010633 RepID=A0A835AMW2_9POAL|nr:hypothetical protein HU200_050932 [Digitaria exilis]